jgi:uncharacterized protein (UPF0548 family)
MFLIRPPRDQFIHQLVSRLRESKFTYDELGHTRDSHCPPTFSVNQASAIIAHGAEGFARAKAAIREYQMLNLGWLRTVGQPEPITEGSIVCTLVRQLPLYSLNVARIVYVDDTPNRFGFGYGTLAEYPVIGEERFSVTLDQNTGEVTYELFSFSRPKTLILRAAQPLIRRAQRRFGRHSIARMGAACTLDDSGIRH